jgi:hypothetical protein
VAVVVVEWPVATFVFAAVFVFACYMLMLELDDTQHVTRALCAIAIVQMQMQTAF